MLIEGPMGLLNVFAEPRFTDLCDERLFTVQASDPKILKVLKPPSYAEYRVQLEEPMFPFNAFVYAWHIEHIFDSKEIKAIETLNENVNPDPPAFCFEAEFYSEDNSVSYDFDFDEIQTTSIGYFLKNQLSQQKSDLKEKSEGFRIYPIYRSLTQQELRTIWLA